MARSKLKKNKKIAKKPIDEISIDDAKVPIPNLPDKFLWMKVKSGTKIRNVLEYSLKEFSSYDSIVWSGAGQGIGKVISCAEIFKRRIIGLHQITKLRYVQSKKTGKKNGDENTAIGRAVPEIHILLSKNITDTKEPGYQAPGLCSMFQDPKVTGSTEKSSYKQEGQFSRKTRMSDVTAEEFASMGLRTGQKRPRQQNQAHGSSKKSKKRGNDENQ